MGRGLKIQQIKPKRAIIFATFLAIVGLGTVILVSRGRGHASGYARLRIVYTNPNGMGRCRIESAAIYRPQTEMTHLGFAPK